MSKYVVAIVTGFVVAFAVTLGMTALLAAAGGPQTLSPLLVGMLTGVTTAYLMANLAGNRKVGTADPATKAEAAKLTPPPGKALICLYRQGFVGKAAGLNVAVDGKVVTQLKSPRFTCIAVAPGEHTVSAAFGGLAGAQNASSSVTVTLAAGQVAAFRYSVSMGLIQNTIAVTSEANLDTVRAAIAGMPMTVPDVAEV